MYVIGERLIGDKLESLVALPRNVKNSDKLIKLLLISEIIGNKLMVYMPAHQEERG